jgi:hypothetical protein
MQDTTSKKACRLKAKGRVSSRRLAWASCHCLIRQSRQASHTIRMIFFCLFCESCARRKVRREVAENHARTPALVFVPLLGNGPRDMRIIDDPREVGNLGLAHGAHSVSTRVPAHSSRRPSREPFSPSPQQSTPQSAAAPHDLPPLLLVATRHDTYGTADCRVLAISAHA